MATTNKVFDSSKAVIEQLLEEERKAMEAYRDRAAQNNDPQVQSVLNKVAELRERYYAELQLQIDEMRAHDEITREMNEMFL